MPKKKQEQPQKAPKKSSPVKKTATTKKRGKQQIATPAQTKENIISLERELGRDEMKKMPIVGLGASAGGLEALESFFSKMPEDTGIAFVLIVHLSPGHSSMMSELLQRKTKLKVQQIEDNMKVEANNIYVIPPKKQVAILNGSLFLSELDQHPGVQLPIDSFLRTLAQDQEDNAICIILSGTGTDGTLGLKEIKGQAGMVMVQDEKTAKYDGMPRSAIDTGLVDFVLPPEEMPEKLITYVRHAAEKPVIKRIPVGEEFATSLQKIFILLRSQTSHDFSNYKQNTIIRRIERRMHVHQIDRVQDYVHYLEQNKRELKILFKELLIGVTSFFRDPEAFEVLKKILLEKMEAEKTKSTDFRVWVPGCSSGEEAYTVGIILQECMEEMGHHFNVQIFGTDIDEDAINTAREGVYPASISSDITPARLKHYFVLDGNQYRVKKSIREMLVFALQNMIKDPPFTKLDLLCCRNLLIYLNSKIQGKILPLFHYSLKPNGILFLGSSETIGQSTALFNTIDRKWRIFSKEPVAIGQEAILTLHDVCEGVYADVEIARPEAARKEGKVDALQLVETILKNSGMPPCAVVDEDGTIIYVHGRTGKFLEVAPGRADFKIMEMAKVGLKHELAGALRKATYQKTDQHLKGIVIRDDYGEAHLNLTVQPIKEPKALRGLMLVIFKEIADKHKAIKKHEAAGPGQKGRSYNELEKELLHTKEDLQTTIEELEASNEELKSNNEELQSTNEELQSTNEELETSKEELQSLNEEATTVNTELQNRIDDLARTNDDLKNLLDSSLGTTIFLDKDLRVRRFTRKATKIVNLLPNDKGRPISHFALNLKGVSLEEVAEEVLDNLEKKELELESNDGNFYLMRATPYRTVDNMINGVVFTFEDITQHKELESDLLRAKTFAEDIVDTVRQPLVVLDGEMKVVTANRTFYHFFQVSEKETMGRKLYDLGNGQWDIPRLQELLEKILLQNVTVEDFEVRGTFPKLGCRTMLLNARRMQTKDRKNEQILLAIEDITDKAKP